MVGAEDGLSPFELAQKLLVELGLHAGPLTLVAHSMGAIIAACFRYLNVAVIEPQEAAAKAAGEVCHCPLTDDLGNCSAMPYLAPTSAIDSSNLPSVIATQQNI